MLIIDSEATAFKTTQAPFEGDVEKRHSAPARRRRQPAAAQQGAIPLMTSTPLRQAPRGHVLNYEEQDEQEANVVDPTQAPQALLQAPTTLQAPTPEATVDRPPAVVAHVGDGERYWVAQAGRCIPANIPSAKKKQWTRLLEQLALTKPFKPTLYGELQLRNNGNDEESNAIRGSLYLDVLRH
jgi:cell wall-associated NlpC family hydrolase